MKRLIVTAASLLCLFLACQAFGQDASLSGTVTDASGGVIPGATVTATNDATGVVSTTVTNAAGVYSFPRLLLGVYTVKSEQKGFKPMSFTKVTLGAGQQARLNFQMEVSGVETKVEVSTSAEQLLIESSSSVGDVLSAQTVQELPLVNRNALDLVKIMSGVVLSDDPIFGANNSQFAGVSASGVNIQRDGITVNDVRWPAGINAATRVNPDLVGEFRMILAPVDAEVGRGNAQIQLATKAGTNEYHGGVVWNVQNTALDPNTWENNRLGQRPPWRNLHQWTGSVGGPIVKNKTFFFALYDGQLNKIRTPYNAATLTPCAQKGIYRFWDRWNNANRLFVATTSTAAGTDPQIATVDGVGNPLRPQWEPTNVGAGTTFGVTPYTGQLRYASVFGTISNLGTLAPDCSNVQVTGNWDALRPVQDPSGFVQDFMSRMPQANNYDIGDGLNVAGSYWSRTLYGADNLFGVGEDTYRRQINLRMDHNFNDAHRINGSWSWEKSWADDNFRTWPDGPGLTKGYGGRAERRPMVLTANFVSSIRPTLLNEFKFGMSRTGTNIFSAYTNPQTGQELRDLLAAHGGKLPNGEIAVIGPGRGTFAFGNDGGTLNSSYYGGRGNLAYSGNDLSPRYSWGDTMSWMRGTHSLRFGGEIRRASSRALNQWTGDFFNGHNAYPYAAGGESTSTPQSFTNVVGDLAGSSANAGNKRSFRDLLVFQSGSLLSIRQWKFINTPTATSWNDFSTDPALDRDVIQREFSLFFKDDWKVRPDLTLNLGVRYDYYGVPYLANGMTVGLEGGGGALLGPTGDINHWFAPISRGSVPTGSLVKLRSIGPDGAFSDDMMYPKNYRNIGPAVGFAYQLPWFGKGKTTVRGGYQISYIGMSGNFSGIQTNAGQAPGTTYVNTFSTNTAGSYLKIADLSSASGPFTSGIPIPSNVTPGIATFTAYDRQQNISYYAPDYKYPYIQNLTFAVTRNVTSNLTVDLRYIGTLTRRNFSTLALNNANYLTNGLLSAFDAARRGEDPALLDQLLNNMALPAFVPPFTFSTCVVNGTTCRGGAALRSANFFTTLPILAPGWVTNLNAMLAQGNYVGLANALNSLTGFGTGYSQRGQYIETNGFPINFIKASPQFNDVTMSTNQGHSNYHSFQTQITLRPTKGMSFQSTYTWSRNLGKSGAYADPRNINDTYAVLSADRPHQWVTYGTFDLPFGPGRSFGKSTSGAVAKAIGNWQISWITTVQSGAPMTISAQSGLYGFGTPDMVGPGIDFESAGVYWPDGAPRGSYFGDRYFTIKDPQCVDPARIAPSLQSLCTLQAVTDGLNGPIVLQNPVPGTKGNLGQARFRQLSRWNVDMSLSKAVMLTETKSIRLRMDFTNIFNHVMPSQGIGVSGTRLTFPNAPQMSINSTTALGNFNTKVGGRTFQFLARFDF